MICQEFDLHAVFYDSTKSNFFALPGPKVFATEPDYHGFDGYSEEVLALAIVMTAFVALVIGKKKAIIVILASMYFLHKYISHVFKSTKVLRFLLSNLTTMDLIDSLKRI